MHRRPQPSSRPQILQARVPRHSGIPEVLPWSNTLEYCLEAVEGLSTDMVETMNSMAYMTYVENLCTAAPNGYVAAFEWQKSDSTKVAFKLKYFNTNEKAVKALDVYFQIVDAQGLPLKSGHSKADCPIEYMQQGEMEAELAVQLPDAEGVEVKVTRVLVTFADGSKAGGRVN